MKNLLKQIALVLGLSVALFSCSKKSDGSVTPGGGSSKWTIAGTSYTGTTTGFTNNQLLSNSTGGEIGIQFASRPTAGTYTIVNQLNTAVTNGTCSITFATNANASAIVSTSGQVTVAINNNKITASYSNVNMGVISGVNNNGQFTFASAGTSTGTLIEQ